jgi:hypothetical protein
MTKAPVEQQERRHGVKHAGASNQGENPGKL